MAVGVVEELDGLTVAEGVGGTGGIPDDFEHLGRGCVHRAREDVADDTGRALGQTVRRCVTFCPGPQIEHGADAALLQFCGIRVRECVEGDGLYRTPVRTVAPEEVVYPPMSRRFGRDASGMHVPGPVVVVSCVTDVLSSLSGRCGCRRPLWTIGCSGAVQQYRRHVVLPARFSLLRP
ncbi:hypothetical protein GCM10009823_32060 [Brevibacterium salitolerans]|uniref:Uncharacterized protein n=1 Tax=Brevibacterium salitolerans TaxID=1403566 RepID=A0ABN2X786_9MICO